MALNARYPTYSLDFSRLNKVEGLDLLYYWAQKLDFTAAERMCSTFFDL